VAPEATVPTAAPLATAAAFRARAQGHPVFSGLTQACMRDTLGHYSSFSGHPWTRYVANLESHWNLSSPETDLKLAP